MKLNLNRSVDATIQKENSARSRNNNSDIQIVPNDVHAASFHENSNKTPFAQFNKNIEDKMKVRELNTNLVSKSFMDVREISKEQLRQSIEKEKYYLFKEKKDFQLEKAKRRFSQTERVQQKLKAYITKPKPKVEDYYRKYVEYIWVNVVITK